MIKNVTYLIFIFLIVSCNVKDCFEPDGTIITRDIDVGNFNKIIVGNEISLIIKQGTEQKVTVKTGENLIDNISVNVVDEQLQLEDENSCNLTRDYATTTVIVTSPNIKEIRSNTSRSIKSEGVLKFPVLHLLSEDYLDSSLLNIGDFDLHVDMDDLIIQCNGNSQFHIKGKTNGLRIEFTAGSSRYEGKNLISKKAYIIHKSTNDIIVNPQNTIKAFIYNIGNVISYNIPNEIVLEEHYTGRLIFN
jgi:hypothetical protein